jgi:hypothetical protein
LSVSTALFGGNNFGGGLVGGYVYTVITWNDVEIDIAPETVYNESYAYTGKVI